MNFIQRLAHVADSNGLGFMLSPVDLHVMVCGGLGNR